MLHDIHQQNENIGSIESRENMHEKIAKSKHLTLTTLSIIETGNIDRRRILIRSSHMNLVIANCFDSLVDLRLDCPDCCVGTH